MTARHIEEPLVLLLHLLHHAQQERFTLPRVLLTLQGRLLAGLGRLQLAAQQITLQAQQITFLVQQITFLVHGAQGLCFRGDVRLERVTGAWWNILERSRSGLWRAPLERVACTQQFGSVDMAIRINAQAACTDSTVQGGARYTCYTRRVTDGELGHAGPLCKIERHPPR
jgi:hypothetical protein